MKKIGKELRYQRESNHLSQNELARATGFTQAAISLWEKDERTPSIDACIKLADVYDISLDELVGRDFGKK